MPEPLTLLLVAVAVVGAGSMVAFLLRRRRGATEGPVVATDLDRPVGDHPPEAPVGDHPPEAPAAPVPSAASVVPATGQAPRTDAQGSAWPRPVESVEAWIAARKSVPADEDLVVSRRYRLWRDSAAVLLVVCLVALALTIILAGQGAAP